MKKKFRVIGIIILVLIIGIFISCPEPKPDSKTPIVTSVTVNPGTANVNKGGQQSFSATVTGTNNPSQAVTWSIVQTNKHTQTTISASGVLTVAAAETLDTLTVRATSNIDNTKFGTATVTVINTGATVSSVTVSPDTAIVAKGNAQNFSATVAGTNNPSQAVTWSIVEPGKHTGTTINSSGKLEISLSETLSTLTVRAASNLDNTKFGTAAVTIINPSSWIDPCTQTTKLTGGYVLTYQGGGSQTLPVTSPYRWEIYDYDRETPPQNNPPRLDDVLTWYGPDQGGGGAFKVEWDAYLLARLGLYYGNGQAHNYYENIYIDYNYTRTANNTSGGGYIGAYGWARSPTAPNAVDRLVEWYIVDDWLWDGQIGIGNVDDTFHTPENLGYIDVDGARYQIYRTERDDYSIAGKVRFTQVLSVRQGRRTTGTISVSEHFKEWVELGVPLDSMYEVKFKVESFGGSGWLDMSYLYLEHQVAERDASEICIGEDNSPQPSLPPPNPPTISGNMGNYNYGYTGNGSERNYRQAVWHFNGQQGRPTTAALKASTKIELVLDSAPTASLDLVWQETTSYSGWNNTQILSNSGVAQNGAVWNSGTNTLTITLATAIANYADFLSEINNIQIIFQYSGGDNILDLGIIGATIE